MDNDVAADQRHIPGGSPPRGAARRLETPRTGPRDRGRVDATDRDPRRGRDRGSSRRGARGDSQLGPRRRRARRPPRVLAPNRRADGAPVSASVRVAAVGDIHIGCDTQGRIATALAGIESCADVLLLAGDLDPSRLRGRGSLRGRRTRRGPDPDHRRARQPRPSRRRTGPRCPVPPRRRNHRAGRNRHHHRPERPRTRSRRYQRLRWRLSRQIRQRLRGTGDASVRPPQHRHCSPARTMPRRPGRRRPGRAPPLLAGPRHARRRTPRTVSRSSAATCSPKRSIARCQTSSSTDTPTAERNAV